MKEIWKDIKDYNGFYQVSDKGRVRNKNGKILKSWFKNRYLYKDIILTKNGKRKHHLIHRLVAEAFIPNSDNLKEINHINGIRFWNSVENLEWVTSKQNNNRRVF